MANNPASRCPSNQIQSTKCSCLNRVVGKGGGSVQRRASAMCSKVNQARPLYTEGPVIFIMFKNTPSWELISFHIPAQLLVSIAVYLSRLKINQSALGSPPPPRPPLPDLPHPKPNHPASSRSATLTGLFEQREVLSYDK